MRVERIGDAVLYLGNAEDIVADLTNVGAVVTDPPFGMKFQSNYRAVKHRLILNDASDRLLSFATKIEASHSKYIFCRWDNLATLTKPKSVVTWVKNNWSMGDLEHEHARQSECILFYPGPEHDFPKYRPTDVISAPRSGNENHPTEKPVQLMRAVVEWTRGTVLDPFCGSGSTGIACAKLGRKFIGIEIDEAYFNIACRRIERAHNQADLFVPRPSADTYDEPFRSLFEERS